MGNTEILTVISCYIWQQGYIGYMSIHTGEENHHQVILTPYIIDTSWMKRWLCIGSTNRLLHPRRRPSPPRKERHAWWEWRCIYIYIYVYVSDLQHDLSITFNICPICFTIFAACLNIFHNVFNIYVCVRVYLFPTDLRIAWFFSCDAGVQAAHPVLHQRRHWMSARDMWPDHADVPAMIPFRCLNCVIHSQRRTYSICHFKACFRYNDLSRANSLIGMSLVNRHSVLQVCVCVFGHRLVVLWILWSFCAWR